jgi:hypothetical protein
MNSTNYFNTFIEIADDCPVTIAEIPPQKAEKTAMNLAFDMIKNHPYQFTCDEVLFQVFAVKNKISETDWNTEKQKFFSKGQACFRSSPLAKRYGWGIHCNAEGKIALYAVESAEYKNLSQDDNLKIIKAIRSKRLEH